MAKFLVISEYQDPHPDPQGCGDAGIVLRNERTHKQMIWKTRTIYPVDINTMGIIKAMGYEIF